jgi:hypothetical protein
MGLSAPAGGVAELVPGNYRVVPNGPHCDRPSWHVLTERGSGIVPVYRDRNGDSRYSEAELASPTTGDSILFHVPNPVRPNVPSSIGCINLRGSDWDEFTRSVGGARATFAFTLVRSSRIDPDALSASPRGR